MATHTADGNLVIQGTGALRTVPMSCAKAWRVEQPAWGLRALHLDLSQPSGSLQTWSCGKEVKRGGRHQRTGLCWVQCVESRRCVWQRMMEVVDDGISHWRGKGSSELPSGEQDAAASKWSCMRLFPLGNTGFGGKVLPCVGEGLQAPQVTPHSFTHLTLNARASKHSPGSPRLTLSSSGNRCRALASLFHADAGAAFHGHAHEPKAAPLLLAAAV